MKKASFQLTLLGLLVALIWGMNSTSFVTSPEENHEQNQKVAQRELVTADEVSTGQAAIVRPGPAQDLESFEAAFDVVEDKEDFKDPVALKKHGVDRLMMMAFQNKGELFISALNEVGDLQKLAKLTDKEGNGLLHWAVMGGCEPCFLALVAKGMDVNQANARGETPLVFAASSGEEMMVKRLLQAGADPNVKFNRAGYTLLMDAAFEGLTPVAHDLIRAKANINSQDKGGQSALHYAAKEGHRELIELLIKAGADKNLTDHNNKRALDYALEYHDTSIKDHFNL